MIVDDLSGGRMSRGAGMGPDDGRVHIGDRVVIVSGVNEGGVGEVTGGDEDQGLFEVTLDSGETVSDYVAQLDFEGN